RSSARRGGFPSLLRLPTGSSLEIGRCESCPRGWPEGSTMPEALRLRIPEQGTAVLERPRRVEVCLLPNPLRGGYSQPTLPGCDHSAAHPAAPRWRRMRVQETDWGDCPMKP